MDSILRRKQRYSFFKFSNESEIFEFNDSIYNLDEDQINNYMTENNLEFSIINNYTGGTFSEEIDNKIFELDVNELSDPINYENLGFYIFKVSEINKREVTQFSEAKDAITNLLALEEAYQDFDDTINILDEMLINDYSFEELSNAELNIKLSKNINRTIRGKIR